jgi:RNA polymerase sigma-70 factor (ECF subfamily)
LVVLVFLTARFSRTKGSEQLVRTVIVNRPSDVMNAGSPPAGDRAAEFEALYARHSREVWALAYARRMDAEMAMDVAQEAFLRLWKSWEEGEAILNPRAWVLRVARNLAEDAAKSSFRRNGTQPPEQLNGVHGREPPPIDRLEREEVFAKLRGQIAELPEADRAVLTLRYAFDYDAQTIAAILEINVTAVHMRLSRARQRLAQKLSAQGVTSSP